VFISKFSRLAAKITRVSDVRYQVSCIDNSKSKPYMQTHVKTCMRNTLSYRHTDIHTEAKRLLQVSVHSSILCRLGENYIIFKTLLLLTGMCVDFVQSVFVNENMIQINIILELLHQLVA
jgi:hypothetical protein